VPWTITFAPPRGSQCCSGWSVGAWFIPLFNLVRPKQIIDDAWRSSSPTISRSQSPPWWCHVWWGVFLISRIGTIVPAAEGTKTLHAVVSHDTSEAVVTGLGIVAAAFAIALVAALTKRVATVPLPTLVSSVTGATGYHFSPAPGWPLQPYGWTPPPGWVPDPSWPPAPADWAFWTPFDA
jgi:hypothetical protein